MNVQELGSLIRRRRKELGLRQNDVSFSTGIGTRYISELENGKPTCEIGKALEVIETLGLTIQISEKRGPGI